MPYSRLFAQKFAPNSKFLYFLLSYFAISLVIRPSIAVYDSSLKRFTIAWTDFHLDHFDFLIIYITPDCDKLFGAYLKDLGRAVKLHVIFISENGLDRIFPSVENEAIAGLKTADGTAKDCDGIRTRNRDERALSWSVFIWLQDDPPAIVQLCMLRLNRIIAIDSSKYVDAPAKADRRMKVSTMI